MYNAGKFYIGGKWVTPDSAEMLDVTDPATDAVVDRIALGNRNDVDRAVWAARAAFETYSSFSVEDRIALMERIASVYEWRRVEMGEIISREMGAPLSFAVGPQAQQGLAHLKAAITVLKEGFPFEEQRATTRVVKEPIGVCALITAWNWPITLICCKVAPALAAGCTMILKPSESAPLNAHLFAEILHEAGVPPGVFNLVDGTGPEVGDALSRHRDIDMISITGSTNAGIAVAKAAAETVKRVTQELGGKSACIVLDDADVEATAHLATTRLFRNSGQSCAAWTRLLVPQARMAQAIEGARKAAAEVIVGDPQSEATTMGPVANAAQYVRIQSYIAKGIEQGATLVAGGLGRPAGLTKGQFVQPTVFADVVPEMAIAQEEIFGPVMCIMGYRDEDDAVRIANSTVYGLSGAVHSADPARALKLAWRLRTGIVHINETTADYGAPFGGYRQSGNGREWGAYGIEEYLETKALFGIREGMA